MKFLLEFVTCYGSRGSRASSMQPQPPVEETRSLVTENLRSFRRKRVRVVKARGAGASAEWHPSLVSISEDGGLIEKESPPAAPEKKAKRRSGSTRKVHHGRNYSDDNEPGSRSGQSSLLMVVPAFSASPFMF
ncbi:hypothetical protein RJ641_000298 [Dillenia turbinata]|uniref:Uncharacterized protein n=1 Tax=Dillenia turbinata TaxID=194707 RepID=A0AAN8W7U1_9MAGN